MDRIWSRLSQRSRRDAKKGKEKTTEDTESTEGKGEGLTTKGTKNTKIIYSLTTLRLMPSGNRMELRSNRK